MNYNKGFSFSSLFLDKTNRSRLILLIYLIFFIILIVFIRSGLKNSNSSDINNNLNNEIDNSIVDNAVIDDNTNIDFVDSKIKNMFSHIDMNNYEFSYILYYNDDIYSAIGKRFNRKYAFELTDGNSVLSYLASGMVVKAKDKLAVDSSYMTVSFPYYYINYFDNSVLKEILNSSNQISEGEYGITNGQLLNFIDGNYSINSEEIDMNAVNIIKLDLKNSIIVGIDIDLTNLFSFSDDINSVKISLKYSNFGLIDEFDVVF